MNLKYEPKFLLSLIVVLLLFILAYRLLSDVHGNDQSEATDEIQINVFTGSPVNDKPEDYLFETLKERIPLFKYGDRVIFGKLLRNRSDGNCFIMAWPITGNPTFIPHDCPKKKTIPAESHLVGAINVPYNQ